MRQFKAITPVVLVTVLLAIYLWAVTGSAIALIKTGEWHGIGIGVAVLALPVIVVFFVMRELMLASRVQAMANELARLDELPKDELPRSPGGRIDRKAADEAFLHVREVVAEDPENWKNWYNLAFAYEAAGDRSRARQSLRKAAAIRRTQRSERGAGTVAPANAGPEQQSDQ
ncbi:hypothetical protein GCM10010401_02020 [Rarobacter faecitabidus]|uniref:Tetratricopeptide repeat protein n=1 Tax=Rarobacter faecitabidus TaxID=13243 RepID=A0A542ZWB5_RARFA|nr:tetratricopeptide repeat protein [Rarobacter faecitabidus]TQL64663.1 hypothetical protein FB461_1172 [Rarobacter faecitabidus]